jgi:hypothetical protein
MELAAALNDIEGEEFSEVLMEFEARVAKYHVQGRDKGRQGIIEM